MHPAATKPELEQGEDQDDQKKGHRDSRSITEIKVLKCLFVNVDHDAFTSIARTTPGQYDDGVENLNGADHEDDQNKEDSWTQKRKSNPEKKLNRISPVQASG